jgi:hypothetical protein
VALNVTASSRVLGTEIACDALLEDRIAEFAGTTVTGRRSSGESEGNGNDENGGELHSGGWTGFGRQEGF